ncbi:pilus assembly protein TadG-related protein [Sphingomonas sp. 2R-10]|uniref:pilus assembly protein TadG-related protein n=1 Tax=Sphingomonas sp. 2R-10 TaxID=3045148 RepID=UPI000F76A02A|nr:pilus assembly protein TadG-related protein [Sphingomonas sp. 2R-10]MDJ0278509.1 pilus assembly protein TadG-related protein [Sphingomonas sp. 2R-10]
MVHAAIRRLIRRRDGNVAMIVAGGLAMMTGTAVLGVDTATLYLEKRRLQGAADAAALAAAADLDNATVRAQAAVSLSADNGTRLVTMTPGRFVRDPNLSADARFTANAGPGNAARVALESRIKPIFAQVFGRQEVTLNAKATAARIDLAGFSIGTRLASVQGGLPGALLSQLAGSELSLSVMDYNALASGQVDLLKTSELLRTGAGVQAATFEEVLASDIALPRLVTAMAGSTGNSATAQVLRTLATRLPNRTVRLNSIIDLGSLGSRSVADPTRPVQADAYAILREALQIGNGTRQVQSDIDLGIPGIGHTRLWLQIGERPAHSPWLSIGEAGQAVVRSAQTRLWIDIALVNAPLNLGSVRVPIYVELAEAEARLTGIACRGGPANATVALDVTPSIGRAAIADLDPAMLGNFQQAMPLRPAKMVTLPLVSLTGYANVLLGGTSAQRVSFSAADINANVVKSVVTNDIAAALASSVLRNIDIRANVLGLGLSAGLLTSTLGNTLSAAAPALDLIVNQVTALAGVHLGQADVRVDGVRCGTPVLVA